MGGQAKYDMMMVFCGNALQKHHKTLKSSTRRYPDCHILHILNRYNKYDKYFCISLLLFLNKVNNRVYRSAFQTKIHSTQDRNGFDKYSIWQGSDWITCPDQRGAKLPGTRKLQLQQQPWIHHAHAGSILICCIVQVVCYYTTKLCKG